MNITFAMYISVLLLAFRFSRSGAWLVRISCPRNLPLRTKKGEDARRMAEDSFVAIMCTFHAHCEFGGHLCVCMSIILQAENRWSYFNEIEYESCATAGQSKFLFLNALQSVITRIHELVSWMRHYQSMVTVVTQFWSSLRRDFRRSLQS